MNRCNGKLQSLRDPSRREVFEVPQVQRVAISRGELVEQREQALAHLDASGHPRMVDVSDKSVTSRSATAGCTVTLGEELLKNFENGDLINFITIGTNFASLATTR